jgi:lipopolysaccharide transport system permease protein
MQRELGHGSRTAAEQGRTPAQRAHPMPRVHSSPCGPHDLLGHVEPFEQGFVHRLLGWMTEVHAPHLMPLRRARDQLADDLRAAVGAGEPRRERGDEQHSKAVARAHPLAFLRTRPDDSLRRTTSLRWEEGRARGRRRPRCVRSLERSTPARQGRDAPGRSSNGRPKPVLEVVGGPGKLTWDSFRELWEFREVQLAFVARQLRVRYKQAIVGAGWVVLQPLAAAAIFALFLGSYADVPSEGLPYLVFALAGTAAWAYFSVAANTGAESLVANQNLLRKIYFPREILPLTAVLSGLVDLGIGLVLVVCTALVYGITPDVAWLAVPLPLVTLVVFAAAFALGLSSLNIYYRDVRYVLPFLLQVGLFATPIAYPLSLVPGGWRQVYAILNPVAAAVDGLRRVLLHGTWPEPVTAFGALAWSLLLLAGALFLFKRLERGFSDRA